MAMHTALCEELNVFKHLLLLVYLNVAWSQEHFFFLLLGQCEIMEIT